MPAAAATAAYAHQLVAENPGTSAPVMMRATVEAAQAAASLARSVIRTPRVWVTLVGISQYGRDRPALIRAG